MNNHFCIFVLTIAPVLILMGLFVWTGLTDRTAPIDRLDSAPAETQTDRYANTQTEE